MDSARDAVGHSDVQLGEGVLGVNGSLGQVTDGGGLDHVLDGVSLDGLVLRVSSYSKSCPLIAPMARGFVFPPDLLNFLLA